MGRRQPSYVEAMGFVDGATKERAVPQVVMGVGDGWRNAGQKKVCSRGDEFIVFCRKV